MKEEIEKEQGRVKIQGMEGRKGIKDRQLKNKNKMNRMKETGKRGISRGRRDYTAELINVWRA